MHEVKKKGEETLNQVILLELFPKLFAKPYGYVSVSLLWSSLSACKWPKYMLWIFKLKLMGHTQSAYNLTEM